jgi:hypothetical protein
VHVAGLAVSPVIGFELALVTKINKGIQVGIPNSYYIGATAAIAAAGNILFPAKTRHTVSTATSLNRNFGSINKHRNPLAFFICNMRVRTHSYPIANPAKTPSFHKQELSI